MGTGSRTGSTRTESGSGSRPSRGISDTAAPWLTRAMCELHSAAQNETRGGPPTGHAPDGGRREHLADEVHRGDRGLPSEAVTERHEDVGHVDPDRGQLDVLGMGEGRVTPLVDQRRVDLAGRDRLHPERRVQLDEAQLEFVPVGRHQRQGRRHQPAYRRRERRQPEPAADDRPGGVEIRLDLLHAVQQVGTLVGEALAVVRQQNAAAVALQHRRAGLPLELLDLL